MKKRKEETSIHSFICGDMNEPLTKKMIWQDLCTGDVGWLILQCTWICCSGSIALWNIYKVLGDIK